ncbi:MAG: hypothetical protein QMD88_01675 [Coprothermobacterota bacterium]|nr:hypothetical protein [Coprothermobacterota bacterium]
MKIKISLEELRKYLEIEPVEFPSILLPLLTWPINMPREPDPKLWGR